MSEPKSPLEVMLDLAVYAPVGLALTVGEELPKLVGRGRAKLEPRVGTAQMIGKFAVAEGLRRASKLADRRPGGGSVDPLTGPQTSSAGTSTAGSSPAAGASSAAGASRASGTATGTSSTPSDALPGSGPSTVGPSTVSSSPDPGPSTSSRPVVLPAPVASVDPSAVPQVDDLAIPGYDSLSASQVVQRLAGLASDELRAVGAYETATRGRRTILARVAQLQSS